jgi:predicted nucleic acid-binding protein
VKAFLDSDVLLDFFLNREPFADHSAAVLDQCEKGVMTGVTSPLVLSNVYYILRQKTSSEKVMKCIDFLVGQLEIVTMNRESVRAALDSEFSDFEDSLQYGAVSLDGSIDCIVTRNIRDYKKSALPVHTPSEFLAVLRQNA